MSSAILRYLRSGKKRSSNDYLSKSFSKSHDKLKKLTGSHPSNRNEEELKTKRLITDQEMKNLITNLPREVLLHLITTGGLSDRDIAKLTQVDSTLQKILKSPITKDYFRKYAMEAFSLLKNGEGIIKYLRKYSKRRVFAKEETLTHATIIYYKLGSEIGIILNSLNFNNNELRTETMFTFMKSLSIINPRESATRGDNFKTIGWTKKSDSKYTIDENEIDNIVLKLDEMIQRGYQFYTDISYVDDNATVLSVDSDKMQRARNISIKPLIMDGFELIVDGDHIRFTGAILTDNSYLFHPFLKKEGI